MESTSTQLIDQLASAQIRLENSLSNLDLVSLGISEYNRRYLQPKLKHLDHVLQRYGRLLYFSLNGSQTALENFILVDYGGGSGLISILAKEMGIGVVIYNDIYEVSCADVGLLSQALGHELDHVICGDA